MSRSYRYSPDGDEHRPSWKRPVESASLGEIWPNGDARPRKQRKLRQAKTGFCGPVKPEQAMELMRDRVDTVLATLIDRRIVPPFEKEDYAQILNIQICRMLPFYEPGRTGWNDREASLLRYLNVVVDSAVADIVRHCAAKKSQILGTAVPVQEASDNDEEEDGDSISLPYSHNPYRDPRRHMEELWLRMDLESLSKMLTEEERITLDMRVQGNTYPEIVEELNARLRLGVDRFHVMNVTMDGIRKAAIKCGFEPSSGRRESGRENS